MISTRIGSMSMSLYRSNRTKVCEVGEHACDVYSYGKHDAKKRWEALRDPSILCDHGGDMGLSLSSSLPLTLLEPRSVAFASQHSIMQHSLDRYGVTNPA